MLRLANIRGDAPRKRARASSTSKVRTPATGSTSTAMSAVGRCRRSSEGSRLEGRAFLALAAEFAGYTPGDRATQPRRLGATRKPPEGAAEREISFILSRALPLAGTSCRGLPAGARSRHGRCRKICSSIRTLRTFRRAPAIRRSSRSCAIRPANPSACIASGSIRPRRPRPRSTIPRSPLGSIRGGAIRLFPATSFVVLTEGIETALAIRTARPDLPVWAAIAAGHLAECQLPAGITEILIAADHDANGAGLKAAERLAERLVAEGRRVWIALPPEVDTDFADVLGDGRCGSGSRRCCPPPRSSCPASPVLGAVDHRHAIIRSAGPSTTPRSSIRCPASRTSRSNTGEASDGSVRLYKHAGKDKRGQDRWEAVATPFGSVARLRYMDHDEAFGLRVHVEAMDARVRAVDFDRASLARVGASEIKGALFAAGLRTESDGDSLAVQILKAADPDDEIVVVSRPGWHRVEGKDYPLFVTPGGAAISDDEARLELATAARFGTVVRGSIDGWKAAVAAAADAKGCPHFLLGALVRFRRRGAVAGRSRQLRHQPVRAFVERQDHRATARGLGMDLAVDRRGPAAIDALDRERRRGVRPGRVGHGARARRAWPMPTAAPSRG